MVHRHPAVGLVVVLARWWGAGAGADAPSALVTAAPQGLVTAAGAELRPGEPVFAAQAWGSWLELSLPGHPVVVDSRFEAISRATWDDYVAASTADPRWPAILDAWDIRVVIVDRLEQSALLAALEDDPTWERVRRDEDGAVFVLREA